MTNDCNCLFNSLVVFAVGLCFGSFANVFIYRLPRNESNPFKGRSYCPGCKKLIKWYENIPLVSYVFLRARCSGCKVLISPRYPIVELLTGALFMFSYLRFPDAFNTEFLMFITACYVVFTSVICTFVDIDFMILPDEITLSGIVISLVIALFGYFLHIKTFATIMESLIGICLGIGIMMAIRIIGEIIFKKEAMGMGDVKYMGMLGGIFGYRDVSMILMLSCLVGMIVGIVYKLIFKRQYIPFGPFLAISAIALIFFKDDIQRILAMFIFNHR